MQPGQRAGQLVVGLFGEGGAFGIQRGQRLAHRFQQGGMGGALRLQRFVEGANLVDGGGQPGIGGADMGGQILAAQARLGQRVAQGGNARLAVGTQALQPLHTVAEFAHLLAGHAPGVGNGIGHVPCRIGQHRQLPAQPLHIVECGAADRADGGDLRGIVGDEGGEFPGALRQALAGKPSQRLQLAALCCEKLPRDAQLGIDGGQPRFQQGCLALQLARRAREALRLPRAQLMGEQPDERQHRHRAAPRLYPAQPLLRRARAGNIGQHKQHRPRHQRRAAQGRGQPAAPAGGGGRLMLHPVECLGVASQRGMRGKGRVIAFGKWVFTVQREDAGGTSHVLALCDRAIIAKFQSKVSTVARFS